MKPVHHALARHQERLTICSDEAGLILASLPAQKNRFDHQGILVGNIATRDFRFSVGRYGRVSNSITNLKRELRGALRVDGKSLEGVDISCAQPAFLAKLAAEAAASNTEQARNKGMNNNGMNNEATRNKEGRGGSTKKKGIYGAPISDDLREYSLATESGKLYDVLATLLAERGIVMSREALKKKFLCDVLAKRWANERGDEYPSDVEDVFRDRFPGVYRFVREFNVHGRHHANLIRELQRQESSFVIETVAADLCEHHPDLFIITLHDAIFTVPEGVPIVIEAFERGFAKIGFRMSLKQARADQG
jgi:hypothetical protein